MKLALAWWRLEKARFPWLSNFRLESEQTDGINGQETTRLSSLDAASMRYVLYVVQSGLWWTFSSFSAERDRSIAASVT